MTKNFLQLTNNGYTVRISLGNVVNENIVSIMEELEENEFNWCNFMEGDILYYDDGYGELECIRVDKDKKEIIMI